MVSRDASEFGIVSRNSDTSQGDGTAISAPIGLVEQPQARGTGANTVFKSGSLFISNKGMGWTSWKKRWFILTRTSLVFFRSDPNALPQKSGEVNLTLGGIDLNNSGSVVVKADKKLLTVQFPDGRDGRTFTLKAETSEDLHEWKAALENALAQAPSPALVGQTGIFRNDLSDSLEGSFEQWRDRRSVKCSVVGRPILLALEDADGSPSFLEKALRFLEEYGIKVEGILRQSADVEEVELRIREYEEGKIEFSSEEDAHVVGDCVKHVLREFPSTPVPASCCTALLKAYRNEHEDSVDAIRDAVSEAFPEPNRRLLQRILKMMKTVASNTSVNRMSSSAVAACMAPLLLRPLMAGDCVPENDFDISGDGCSAQLLAAAAAANQAYAIVSILLEEYDYIFLDGLRKGSLSSDIYSESGSEDSGSEEESNYDDELLGIVEDGYHDAQNDLDHHLDGDPERSSSGTLSESSDNVGSDIYDDQGSENPDSQGSDSPDTQGSEGPDSDGDSPKDDMYFEAQPKPSQETLAPVHHHNDLQRSYSDLQTPKDNSKAIYARESHDTIGDLPVSTIPKLNSSTLSVSSCTTKPISKVNDSMRNMKRHTFWGRTSARKNLSMESINYSSEDETAIRKLEITKNDLQSKIEKEAKGNAILHSSLERRKQALHERRLALEQDVARLQVQLQRERDLREALEAGLNMAPGQLYVSSIMDSKIKAELKEIALAEEDVTNLKQKVADLHRQLNQQCQHSSGSVCDSCSQNQCADNHQETGKTQVQDVESRSSARYLERSQRSENFSSGADSGKLRTQGKLSLQSKENSQRQKPDSPSLLHSKSTEEVITVLRSTAKKLPSKTIEASTTSEDPVSVMPATSKRTPAKSEGTNSMSLALSKLTTRLNFLKERRTQLTNEIHTLDPASASDSQDLPKTESI